MIGGDHLEEGQRGEGRAEEVGAAAADVPDLAGVETWEMPANNREAITTVRRPPTLPPRADFHPCGRALPRGNSWRIAFCSCVGLAVWRGDKLQQSDATRYDAYHISSLQHDQASPVQHFQSTSYHRLYGFMRQVAGS